MADRDPPRRAVAASRERRAMIAAEAARILAAHGGGDHASARRKAAARLGVDDPRDLPGQDEIEAALREHQRIFRADQQPQALAALRAAAAEALRFFAPFEPRLVGPVLDGTADAGSPVWLHLHADDSAEVVRFLAGQRIPIDEHGRRIALSDGRHVDAPAFRFDADGVDFELLVLPRSALRQAPLARIDGKPLARATLAELLALPWPGVRPGQSA